MTTQKHAARNLSLHGHNRGSDSLLITFCTATGWWSMPPHVARREITAEDSHSRGTERICQRYEKRGIAISSRAVRQDETITARTSREMQVPTDGYFIWWSVQKFLMTAHTYRLWQPNSPRSLIQFHGAPFKS